MRFQVDILHLDTGLALLAFGAVALVLLGIVQVRLRRDKLRHVDYSQQRHHGFTAGTTKKSASGLGYTNVFPPSQRAAAFPNAAVVDLTSDNKRILEMSKDYRLANPSSYIFSGFSVKEVFSLGDFPDYAKLSGVPLPSPLPNFNIDKAVPRPYRPLRWVYHQTMGMASTDRSGLKLTNSLYSL